MRIFSLVLILMRGSSGKLDQNKLDFCRDLNCDESVDQKVCGVKFGEDFHYRLFDNECQLLRHGCQVNESQAYGIINMDFCGGPRIIHRSNDFEKGQFIKECPDCSQINDPVCGIRQDGKGFRVRTFQNECELTKYNCKKGTRFTLTDLFICNGKKPENYKDKIKPRTAPKNKRVTKPKPLVVIHGPKVDKNNINKSIDNFFALTHTNGIPLQEKFVNESLRRILVKNLGPTVIFKPFIEKPKNVSEDIYHLPLLSTCYHKCPLRCPDIYKPVCGYAGANAKEPSIAFQNHCYMDAAQCKMYMDSDGYSAVAYLESGFIFCMGDQLGQVVRFLPVLRTLQRMGRLKKKGRYRYKVRNFRFLNDWIVHPGDIKLMG